MSLRIVGLNAFLPGFRLVHEFAERNGHELVLVATLPETSRYGASDPMVAGLPDSLNVLITRKLRTVAAPVIAALRPDVIISAAFPRLIPDEILEIPKYGAINCHPSPLPAGRGPTPQRLIYEGDERVGATVHRTAAEFDTGAILAQRIAPLPEDLNGSGLMQSWRTLLSECLDEAVPKLVAGDPGQPQDPAIRLRRAVLHRRRTTSRPHRAVPDDPPQSSRSQRHRPHRPGRAGRHHPPHHPNRPGHHQPHRRPGTILEKHPDGWTIQTADHPLRLTHP